MKICFVSSYPPNRARLSEYAQNLVTALADSQKIDALYILADKSQSPEKAMQKNQKVTVLRVWKPDSVLSITSIFFNILKIRPDIVHFNVSYQSFGKHKLTNLAGLTNILACRLFGFQVLVGVHTLAEKTDLEKFHVKPSLVNRVGIFMATKIILSAQTIVVLVKSYGELLRQRYHHRGIKYIPHGTTVDNEKETDGSEKIILIFGHMGPHKGLPLMLQTFEELCKEKNNLKLYVAGSNHPNYPNYLEHFKKNHPSNTSFLGYIPQENISSIFKKAEVVVLPYNATPGTSGVFHLACGYGKPIVASDLPEIKELVNDGASAILVPPNNLQALKKAILEVLSNQDLAAKMSEQNLNFARKESWSTVATAYENAYINLFLKKRINQTPSHPHIKRKTI